MYIRSKNQVQPLTPISMYLFKPKRTQNGVTTVSPNFAVQFRIGGKRIVKGLGTPNKNAALTRAKHLERKDVYKRQGPFR